MAIKQKRESKEETSEIVKTFFELAGLGVIPRSGLIQYCYENLETIAEHSHKVAFIAYFLAVMLKADVAKVLIMAILHDAAETRTGDSNYPQKKYIDRHEAEAIRDQYSDLPSEIKNQLLPNILEYEERKSLESKIVKDADYLAFYITLKQLEFKGNQEAEIRTDMARKIIDFLFLDKSKELLKQILNADPNQWTRPLLLETMKKKAYK